MSSAANLDTNTTGVPPPATEDQAEELRDTQRKASLTLADRARDAAELLTWLDMFGLPPCERRLRSYNPKQYRKQAEGAGT